MNSDFKVVTTKKNQSKQQTQQPQVKKEPKLVPIPQKLVKRTSNTYENDGPLDNKTAAWFMYMVTLLSGMENGVWQILQTLNEEADVIMSKNNLFYNSTTGQMEKRNKVKKNVVEFIHENWEIDVDEVRPEFGNKTYRDVLLTNGFMKFLHNSIKTNYDRSINHDAELKTKWKNVTVQPFYDNRETKEMVVDYTISLWFNPTEDQEEVVVETSVVKKEPVKKTVRDKATALKFESSTEFPVLESSSGEMKKSSIMTRPQSQSASLRSSTKSVKWDATRSRDWTAENSSDEESDSDDMPNHFTDTVSETFES